MTTFDKVSIGVLLAFTLLAIIVIFLPVESDESKPNCCQAWHDAIRPGTDEQGDQACIAHTRITREQIDGGYAETHYPIPPDSDEVGIFTVGFRLPPIKYCPWCGSKK